MLSVLRGLLAVALVTAAATARADGPPTAAARGVQDYWLSARIGGGVGLGHPGLSARVGVSGEYWFSPVLGMGLTASLLRQTEIFGDDSASEGVGVLGALRSAAHGHYFYSSLGLGYAHVKHTDDGGLCLNGPAGCPYRELRYDGFLLSAALGWLAHPFGGPAEVGPMLRIDLMFDPRGRVTADYAFTVGVELGLVQ